MLMLIVLGRFYSNRLYVKFSVFNLKNYKYDLVEKQLDDIIRLGVQERKGLLRIILFCGYKSDRVGGIYVGVSFFR